MLPKQARMLPRIMFSPPWIMASRKFAPILASMAITPKARSQNDARTETMTPSVRARLAGAFYLLNFGAPISLFKVQSLLVAGDAAATARNILADEGVFRLTIAGGVLAYAAYMVVAVLLYDLFRPVNKSLSMLAGVFCIAGSLVAALSALFQIAPLALLAGCDTTAAASATGAQAAAFFSLKMYAQGFTLSMVFFGFYMMLIGALVLQATFVPRILGALTALTGAAYLIHGLAYIAVPSVASAIVGYVYLFGLGELAFVLWILLAGVDDERWLRQSGFAATRA